MYLFYMMRSIYFLLNYYRMNIFVIFFLVLVTNTLPKKVNRQEANKAKVRFKFSSLNNQEQQIFSKARNDLQQFDALDFHKSKNKMSTLSPTFELGKLKTQKKIQPTVGLQEDYVIVLPATPFQQARKQIMENRLKRSSSQKTIKSTPSKQTKQHLSKNSNSKLSQSSHRSKDKSKQKNAFHSNNLQRQQKKITSSKKKISKQDISDPKNPIKFIFQRNNSMHIEQGSHQIFPSKQQLQPNGHQGNRRKLGVRRHKLKHNNKLHNHDQSEQKKESSHQRNSVRLSDPQPLFPTEILSKFKSTGSQTDCQNMFAFHHPSVFNKPFRKQKKMFQAQCMHPIYEIGNHHSPTDQKAHHQLKDSPKYVRPLWSSLEKLSKLVEQKRQYDRKSLNCKKLQTTQQNANRQSKNNIKQLKKINSGIKDVKFQKYS